MDFDKYVDCLTQVDNEENRAELETLYTLNRPVVKYFKGIDATVDEVLKSSHISPAAIKHLENAIPSLSKLKKDVALAEKSKDALTEKYKARILSAIDNIKESMTLSEVSLCEKELSELLQADAKEQSRLQAEEEKRHQREEEDKKHKAQQAKEQKEREFESLEKAYLLNTVSDFKTVSMIAEKSSNEEVLSKCVKDHRISVLRSLEKNHNLTTRLKTEVATRILQIEEEKKENNKKDSDGCGWFMFSLSIAILMLLIYLFITIVKQ